MCVYEINEHQGLSQVCRIAKNMFRTMCVTGSISLYTYNFVFGLVMLVLVRYGLIYLILYIVSHWVRVRFMDWT
jgi:hypothetical protein